MNLKRFEQGRFKAILKNETNRFDPKEESILVIRDDEVLCAIAPEMVADLHSVLWSMLDAIENDDWREPLAAVAAG